ncbi:hypothetical protein JW933_11975 [candidate division FCPU426 bacterium]|nr:hypothetical protein [candidate division FCPU426 bacterium]
MWICDQCGKPLDDTLQKCTLCGAEKKEQISKKAGKAHASRTFEFGADKPKEETTPEPAIVEETPPEEKAEPKAPLVQERPIVTIAKRLVKTQRFWIIFGSVLLAFIVIPGSISLVGKLASRKPKTVSTTAITPELRQKFEKMIEDILPDKLEWARAIMSLRIPTRFPEELAMEIDKKNAEVRYDNKQKTEAYYRFLVCYHFVDAHKKTYRWQPVTFYFEMRNGVWTMVGDLWIKESEMIFE